MNWRLVILESPFAGVGLSTTDRLIDERENRRYLDRAIRHCIQRGDTPYASHKMLTDALSDADPEERALGIEAGIVWAPKADVVCVYVDRGISKGMKYAIDKALSDNRLVEFWSLVHGRVELSAEAMAGIAR